MSLAGIISLLPLKTQDVRRCLLCWQQNKPNELAKSILIRLKNQAAFLLSKRRLLLLIWIKISFLILFQVDLKWRVLMIAMEYRMRIKANPEYDRRNTSSTGIPVVCWSLFKPCGGNSNFAISNKKSMGIQ